jgi:hypothetical protein
LVVIDQRPLQRAAWSEFHAARKLHEKTARDLHRHEETDTPAFERWLHTAFPVQISSLRELHQQVEHLSREVEIAQYLAAVSGRSVKKIWREHKEHQAAPEDHPPEPAPPENEINDHDFESAHEPDFEFAPEPRDPSTPPADETRDLYRRLVQRLHPDRGGEWTPARERLWHEVQQAWEARDADWLARLEIEWETAHDVINENSSISRLRQAIKELQAARRDTERKLRHYRKTSAWRFTLSEKKRPQLQRRTKSELLHDIDVLQRQLAYLRATISAWEEPIPSRTRGHRRR